MIHFKSLSELHETCNVPPPEHPFLSLYSFQEPPTIFPEQVTSFTGDFYQLSLKTIQKGMVLYGKTKYDQTKGTMSFIKPRQVVELKNLAFEENGFFISIHEDYLLGHQLYHDIQKYSYFDYQVNEALHCSPSEERIVREIYQKMETEYYNNQDEMSKEIILSHLDSLLKYAQRFYNRQFINRKELSSQMERNLQETLKAYLGDGKALSEGLPTVKALAESLKVSSRYLSDTLKQHTGKTALEHIHLFVINEAKNLLLGTEKNISETAFLLGFEHPPYFSRLFKKVVGVSPKVFRDMHGQN